ncbi:cofactor-independent phosphoglycerate mutase [Cantharellus anzutake]|uniref:cofactor-independent phosphoglycerate mutase n=1 Tax=Cantharellus anzutake TaxID=1750568 RepID=UPI001905B00C|nr:cofactor-independent phosphoglycerate mutase [Cantharellus anzutake]KAF8334712.1 cofactor-independent phosphoglycerate mutase [Cantharellus anzutake]
MASVKNKVCLIVHDGWGYSPETKGNAVNEGTTENMDRLGQEGDHRLIEAHGLSVGLNDGLMGNSEVGHLNIGAGRVVWQDIVRIDESIRRKKFEKTENIVNSFKRAKETNGRLHLLGLISDGGVHSHINHLLALLETAKKLEVPEVYVHFFGDGRDTAPRSATIYLKQLNDFIEKEKFGKVATVIGRYYAMDRDKRWERIKVGVDGLTGKLGKSDDILIASNGDDAVAKIEENYKKDITDEFLKPILVGGDEGRIQDNDTLFFFNYRSDRMREITAVFGVDPKPMDVYVPKNLYITTMTRYNVEYTFPIAFPPQTMGNVLAEWLSVKGLKQCHIAETEKYAHVTFFFNGGVEKQFEREDRIMIPSPKVPTYDKKPEMSVLEVAGKVAEVLNTNEYPFVMCNFAPPDMVGHTGVYNAAVQAITATDAAVGTIAKAAAENDYVLIITADHGNAEQMINLETGAPHTAHTTNPVPLIVKAPNSFQGQPFKFIGDEEAGKGGEEGESEKGALCDVAPTILDILGLDQPQDMTGRSLLKH